MEKKRKILKFNDIVNFYLVGKGNYQYCVAPSYLNIGDDTNAKIFIELGMSPDEKRQICDKAYGYQARYDGQWPECKDGDYEALTRLVNMLYLECNIYNKRVRDLEGIEV